MKNIILFCIVFLYSIFSYSQTWRYNDSISNIGWNTIEFNEQYLVSVTTTDSSTSLQEPALVVLSKEGVKQKKIYLPLTKHQLLRGIFTAMASHSEDTLLLGGLAYASSDSSANLVVLTLNKKLEVVNTAITKLEVEGIKVPSRSYTNRLSIHFDNEQHNYYGSLALCSTKNNANDLPSLSSYSMPCAHVFFKLSSTGSPIMLKSMPVNVQNREGYIMPKTNYSICKAPSQDGYLLNCFTEGMMWLNDSFTTIKKQTPNLREYLPVSGANDFVRQQQYYYLLGLVNYNEFRRNGAVELSMFQNRILVQKFSLNGNLEAEKLLYPVLPTDSATWREREGNINEDFYDAWLFNGIINSAIATKDGGLVYTYRNQRGGLFVMRIDTSLNITWTKTIKMPYFNYYSIIQTSDSGFVLTGWSATASYVSLPMYAIKIDANGQLTNTNVLNAHLNELVIYPNPFTDKVFVRYQLDVTNKAELYLYNTNGTEVLKAWVKSEESIDVSALPPGLYICQLKHNNQLLSKPYKLIKY